MNTETGDRLVPRGLESSWGPYGLRGRERFEIGIGGVHLRAGLLPRYSGLNEKAIKRRRYEKKEAARRRPGRERPGRGRERERSATLARTKRRGVTVDYSVSKQTRAGPASAAPHAAVA